MSRMRGWWKDFGAGGLLLGALVAGLGFFALLGGADPLQVNLEDVLAGPSAGHFLGADDLGRDILSRLAAGVRLSLLVGFSVLAVTAVIGIPLGVAAGWFGGWVDALVQKLTEVVLSFPGILLALALAALVGGGTGNIIVALGALGWVGFCRLARVDVQRLKHMAFMEAAVMAGVRPGKLMFRYLLPNCAGPLLVQALLVLAGTMVAEAGLSFLGLGIPAPLPSLGGMLRDGMKMLLVAPMLVVYPSVVLIGLTVSVNMLAEGLRRRWADGNELGR